MNDRTFRAKDAHKLEDPDRLNWLHPDEVTQKLGLVPGMNVADVGAGTGYFALPLAQAIAPNGRLFAIDFQAGMLEILQRKLNGGGGHENIELMEGTANGTGLPDKSCDLVLLANIWHELDDHASVLREAARILRDGGRVAILDWRPDVTRPPGPPIEHRIAGTRTNATLEAHDFRVLASAPVGKYSYLIVAASGHALAGGEEGL